jgi:hypothetical protein
MHSFVVLELVDRLPEFQNTSNRKIQKLMLFFQILKEVGSLTKLNMEFFLLINKNKDIDLKTPLIPLYKELD